jgi:hypothetical protein
MSILLIPTHTYHRPLADFSYIITIEIHLDGTTYINVHDRFLIFSRVLAHLQPVAVPGVRSVGVCDVIAFVHRGRDVRSASLIHHHRYLCAGTVGRPLLRSRWVCLQFTNFTQTIPYSLIPRYGILHMPARVSPARDLTLLLFSGVYEGVLVQ